MRNYRLFLIIVACLVLSSCGRSRFAGQTAVLERIRMSFGIGDFTLVKMLTDSLKRTCHDEFVLHEADSLSQIAERIIIDFPYDEEDIVKQLNARMYHYTVEEKAKWESDNWLECRIIDGEKKYYRRAVSNLGHLLSFYMHRSSRDSLNGADPAMIFRRRHTENIIRESGKTFSPVAPVDMTISYTLTVKADAVPEGEIVRCWLPFPRANHDRQLDVRLLSASARDYQISPDSAIHGTIYMESAAIKGEPVVFNVRFRYISSGQYFQPGLPGSLPYRKNTWLFRKYTSEQPPQIIFSDRLKRLADSIAGDEKNPYEIARKIYYWFSDNIPWTGAVEYSTMPDIPGYVMENMRGDCGMQTLLLISMLRYKGIPARWQSGWMVPPGAENLHDWAEIYYDGTGWVPVDVSYGLQYSEDIPIREFYITGIDSYRLIINDGIAGKLYPEKKFMRSDPYDFQRGEVEWSGANLYFDKWDYNMEIIYN